MLEYYQVKNTELPVILGLHSKGEGIFSKYKYHYPQINEINLSLWLDNLNRGLLSRFYQSETLPEEPIHENIPVIVGNSLFDLVLNNKKDVLLLVYNPWEDENKLVIIKVII